MGTLAAAMTTAACATPAESPVSTANSERALGISSYFTLKPGDVIYTGTPHGVIQGMPAAKRVWLKPGDKIACSLEKLGELTFDLV